jgi:hypothetical protein
VASSLRELEEFARLSPSDPLYIHQDPMPAGADIMTQQEAIEVLNQRSELARGQTVSAFESSLWPLNPNFRSTVNFGLNNLLGGSNVASNSGYFRGKLANALSGLLDFTPVVGDAVGVGDTMTSYRQGDMLGTGINAAATGIGVLPLVGGPASKAVKAGGKKVRSALRGLDPSSTARMARAQEGGFDMDNTYYHGTSSDFTELQPSTVGDLGGGIYVTPNPEKASGYAAVRKFMKRQTNNASPNVLPLRVKNNLNYLDLQGGSILPFDDVRINNLKEQGYDGIRQFDSDGNVIQMNIFDPKNIRSTNAKFDPTKADSADLLSSISPTQSSLRNIA